MDTVTPEVIRKKKLFILLCGVIIFFLTSMAKVLIPATIFNDLQKLGLPIERISSLGAAFLYAYAASQLLMGCFSDRYGGVRILLIGGSLFSTGTIFFPLVQNYYLMTIMRILSGFGAGTIFLGVAKLSDDLFPARLGVALGFVLFFSYLGPTTGTVPMVKLVETIGWRPAMLTPGIIALIAVVIITSLSKGTIKPITKGQTFAPLIATVKNKTIWLICFACASVFGAYYTIVGQIGQKIFTDFFALPSGTAAFCIMFLTIVVALNTMGVNLWLKLCGNKRKVVLIGGTLLSSLGIVIAKFVLSLNGTVILFLTALIFTAFTAGFFPLYSIIAQEVSAPDFSVMAMAFVNFMAFVFISLYQIITGFILKAYPPAPGELTFPAEAYSAVFNFFIIGAVFSIIAAMLVQETKPENT